MIAHLTSIWRFRHFWLSLVRLDLRNRYRRSVLGTRRFNERWRMVLDLEFFTRLLLDGDRIVGLPVEAFAYRRHSENATVAYTENLDRFREESRLLDELGHAAAARGWDEAARIARRKTIVKLNLLYCGGIDLARLRPHQAWRKASLLWRLNAA